MIQNTLRYHGYKTVKNIFSSSCYWKK